MGEDKMGKTEENDKIEKVKYKRKGYNISNGELYKD